jgi:hypothetical protein
VKLAAYIVTLADLAKLLIGAVIGFIGAFFTRWPLDKLAERRALLKSIGDRYIANAQATPINKVTSSGVSECFRSWVRRSLVHVSCLASAVGSSLTDYKTRCSERCLLFLKIAVARCEGFYIALLRRVLT